MLLRRVVVLPVLLVGSVVAGGLGQAGATPNGATGSSGGLTALDVGPAGLVPAFSPDIVDYTTRCADGVNTLHVTGAAEPGSEVLVDGRPAGDGGATDEEAIDVEVEVSPDGLVEVAASTADGGSARYWVRCLPPDFPPITVERPGTPAAGWYLVASGLLPPAGESPYAIVLDDHGVPVWYERTDGPVIDVRRSDDGLIGWVPYLGLGTVLDPGLGAYRFQALDGGLRREVGTGGAPIDPHDLVLLPDGNRLMLTYEVVGDLDLSSLGPEYADVTKVLASHIQELTPDGEVVWEWRGEDHIGLDEVRHPAVLDLDGEPVADVHHVNSIEVGEDGDLLISARQLDAVYDIDRQTGAVRWKLGGAPVARDGARVLSVLDDPLGGPVLQHDARLLPDGHLTLFDDQSTTTNPSRSVEYVLDLDAGTARLVWSYDDPDGTTSGAMGSSRRQADGATVVGWGLSANWFTEVGPDGATLLDVRSSGPTYRAVKVPADAFDRDELRFGAAGGAGELSRESAARSDPDGAAVG